MLDIADRQAALQAEHKAVTALRMAAAKAGEKSDPSPLLAIESELAALDDVSLEQGRQRRAEAQREEAARRAAIGGAIQARETERAVELVRAQQAATALTASILKFKKLTDAQIAAFVSIDMPAPPQLYRAQVERRLSQMLTATVLAPIATDQHLFGGVNWRSIPSEVRVAWPDYELAVCENAIKLTLNQTGEKSDGTNTSD